MQAASDQQLSFSGDYLRVVRDFALSKGISLEALLHQSSIDVQQLIDPPELVHEPMVNYIGKNLYDALDDPIAEAFEFGLRMTVASHGALGLAVQCAENLAQASEILRQFYHTRISFQDVAIEENEQFLLISLVTSSQLSHVSFEAQCFFDIGTLVSIATNTYEAMDHAGLEGKMRLFVPVDRPEIDQEKLGLRGLQVQFGADALGLAIPLSWKHAGFRIANPAMAKAARERCVSELQAFDQAGVVERVLRRLKASPSAFPSLENLAKEFYMSPATFKRRLKQEGRSYQSLKDQLRSELAHHYLLDKQMSVEVCADALGFSDVSNFTKAFRGWTGQTPKAYVDARRD